MSLRILFAGGGTGGHLYSGIAVAREIERLAPGCEIVFVGTAAGIEARVVPQTAWRLLQLDITGIKGRGPVRALAGVVRAARAVLASRRLLKTERPAVVVGIGGYASGPTVLAAALGGVPTAVIEQNVIPGFTNKVLSRFVRRVYAPSSKTAGYLPARHRTKVEVTGNPIRMDLLEKGSLNFSNPAENRAVHILIFGGSQGARRINDAVIEALPELKARGWTITHQTGKADFERVHAAFQAQGLKSDVRSYIDDMGAQYAHADLVVCRAGASTLAEITALGKPALLVPYPHAIYNHQELNARALADGGAARWVQDAELDGTRLLAELDELTAEPQTLSRMAAAARRAGHPDAATVIAREVLNMAKSDVGTNNEDVVISGNGSAGGAPQAKWSMEECRHHRLHVRGVVPEEVSGPVTVHHSQTATIETTDDGLTASVISVTRGQTAVIEGLL